MTVHKPDLQKLGDLHNRIVEMRKQMCELMKAAPVPVDDYTFKTLEGDVSLSDLFGGKPDLLMVHNMGTGCTGCTLWADGFNGIYPHLADRAAFCVSSPDTPETQKKFAESRGWRFPMVSHKGSSFAEDMGYRGEDGSWHPGLSSFRQEGGKNHTRRHHANGTVRRLLRRLAHVQPAAGRAGRMGAEVQVWLTVNGASHRLTSLTCLLRSCPMIRRSRNVRCSVIRAPS